MTVSQAIKPIGVDIVKPMKVYQILSQTINFPLETTYLHILLYISQQFKVQCSCFTYYINMQWMTLYDISIYRHARYLIVYVYNIILHYSISTFRISFEQILASQNWFII